jgi:hypothetical protein
MFPKILKLNNNDPELQHTVHYITLNNNNGIIEGIN